MFIKKDWEGEYFEKWVSFERHWRLPSQCQSLYVVLIDCIVELQSVDNYENEWYPNHLKIKNNTKCMNAKIHTTTKSDTSA